MIGILIITTPIHHNKTQKDQRVVLIVFLETVNIFGLVLPKFILVILVIQKGMVLIPMGLYGIFILAFAAPKTQPLRRINV